MMDCLFRRDKLLTKELGYAGALEIRMVPESEIPAALRGLVGKPVKCERFLSSYINGDGVTFEFLFIVRRSEGHGAVRALLFNSEYEAG